MKKLLRLLVTLIVVLATTSPCPAAQSAAKPGDRDITQWVDAALKVDPRISSGDIAASSTDGIVTLVGSAYNLAERHFAALEAKKIKGVRGVINRIEVKPVDIPDADIRQHIRHRIVNSAVMTSDHLGVAVKDGQVTLTGTVDSYVQKQEAAVLAAEVRGVVNVDNQIGVHYLTKRSDGEIRKDVESRLTTDVYLVGMPITVTVANGVVTLDGLMSSPYQVDRAFTDAYVIRNVVDVHNKLKVQWNFNAGVGNPEETPPGFDLARTVQEQLALDLRIEQPYDIQVEAQDGHVILNGTVSTYHQRRVAEQDVRNVFGVTWISNLIKVKPVQRGDQAIQGDVRFNLDSDAALRGDIIKAFVRDGSVMLTGTVQTYFQKAQAENDVSRIVGVVEVVDDIDVNPRAKVGDMTLKDHILKRLSTDWATWPVLGDINVAVRDGQATLTGSVHTWQQRQEAGRMAHLTKGVLQVDNRLIVKGAKYDWDKWYGANSNGFVYDPYFNEDLYLNPAKGELY